jgi:spore coat protein U-like protein
MRAVIAAAWRVAVVAACLNLAPAEQKARPPKGDQTCTIQGANVMAFGTYDPVSDTPLDVQGRIAYKCGGKTATKETLNLQISLSAGVAGLFDRRMSGARDTLRYNLYLDASRTRIWGDGTSGTEVYAGKGQQNNQVVVVPVFGRVFASQDVSAAMYIDTLIVTLDF